MSQFARADAYDSIADYRSELQKWSPLDGVYTAVSRFIPKCWFLGHAELIGS